MMNPGRFSRFIAQAERRAPALRVHKSYRFCPNLNFHSSIPGVPRILNRAFTLIEIMLVVAILGIVLAIGLPSIYHMLNKEAMISAIRDLTDLCRNARARAVFKEENVQLHIHVRDGSMQISGGGLVPGAEGSFTKTSAQLSDQIRIEALGVNFQDYTDADEAVVTFFPNGTSDELIIVLQGPHGEEKQISLEVVTAMADVKTLR